MRGSIETRRSKITGRITYRPRVYVGKRDAERYGLESKWHDGGSFDRLRRKEGCDSAEDGLERLLAELKGGATPSRCTDALRALAARWLRDEVKPGDRENTTRAHDLALQNHILEVVIRVDSCPVRMGDVPACELTAADVSEWQAAQLTGGRLDGRTGGCGVKSVRNYRGTLHLLFEWARGVMPESFTANPVEGVKAPRWRRKAPVPPTLDVAQQYVEAMRDTRLWPALVIGQNTGMRRGEVLALRWSDAHWRLLPADDGDPRLVGGVHVHPERGNLTGRTKATLRFGPPKTDKGPRYVPLTEQAIAALIELKAERMRNLLPGQQWDESALICCGRRGQPIVPDNLTHELPIRLRRRGLPPVGFHKLRHMVATEMRRAGVDRDVLAEFLGHADMATTAIYDHVNAADQDAAAALFQARCGEAVEARRARAAPNSGTVVDFASRRASK